MAVALHEPVAMTTESFYRRVGEVEGRHAAWEDAS